MHQSDTNLCSQASRPICHKGLPAILWYSCIWPGGYERHLQSCCFWSDFEDLSTLRRIVACGYCHWAVLSTHHQTNPYGLEKHEGHFTLWRKQMFLALWMFLWEYSCHFFASSLSGSCARLRPSSLCLKLSKHFCWKSNSVNGNDGYISVIFVTSRRILLSFTPELPRDGLIGGSAVKLQNNIYIENQLVLYFLNSPNYGDVC